MKFFSIIAASLAAVAAAAPGGAPKKCTPGTYSCTTNPKTGGPGWKVCNTSGKWVVSAIKSSEVRVLCGNIADASLLRV
jgi:hypothetical protein